MVITLEQAQKIVAERSNGALIGTSPSKGGRAWLDGEWCLAELAANRALFNRVIRERNTCPAGLTHFRHGLKCVVCDADIPSCGNCARSYTGRDPHTVACGCGVDDAALLDEDPTKNPIWAIRRYQSKGLLHMLLSGEEPKGSDDEALSPEDGRECFMWEPRDQQSPGGRDD